MAATNQQHGDALPPRRSPALFSSFWMAGYESACHLNQRGERLDMIAATQHDRYLDEDYGLLRSVGIASVRDTVRWHIVERPGNRFDFSSIAALLSAAQRHRVQIVWDLCHYGWPDGLDVFSPAFVDRFARYCGEVARYIRDHDDRPAIYTPINEISFLSWAAGEVGWFFPHARSRGSELKCQLIRACIAGIEAIWSVDARARITTVEPLIHVVAPRARPDLAAAAAAYRSSQFEACDMLSGLLAPELGGQPRYLDIVGINFYHDNQWEQPGGDKIAWHVLPRDPRWRPLHLLLDEIYQRYRRPIFIAETSHVGSGRAEWLRELTGELISAIAAGVPLEAVCLYPILDRFEWDDRSHWHNSGLWDLFQTGDGAYQRVLNLDYAEQLRRSQAILAGIGRR